MSQLLLALSLTSTQLQDKTLLRGAELRILIADIEDKMKKFSGSKPKNWTDYGTELDKIRNETFTTLRDKSMTKLRMKIIGIADEVNRTLEPDPNKKPIDEIGKKKEDPIEIARKELLLKIDDLKMVCERLIPKQKIEKTKNDFNSCLIDLTKHHKSVTDEPELTKFPDHKLTLTRIEESLELIRINAEIKFDSVLAPTLKPSDLKHEDIVAICKKFTEQLKDLEECNKKRNYSWRTTFDADKTPIQGQIVLAANELTEMNKRLVTLKIAELKLAALSQKIRPLNIPLKMVETQKHELVVKAFIDNLGALTGWVLKEFTEPLDKDEINKALPGAVAKAKEPLNRLLAAIGQVVALIPNCTHEKESVLDSFGLQVKTLASICLQHCGSDPLMVAWDSGPAETDRKTTTELKDAITGIHTQFNCIE